MKFKFDEFDFIDNAFIEGDTLLMVVSGSHAYGWNTEKSDLDVRHVFSPDITRALSVFYRCRTKEHKEQHDAGLIEFTTYPIQPFIGLLAKGNGNVLDNLFEATGPTVLFADKPKVEQLQKIVLDHLHLGFLMHCTGYDFNLKKDMENETRLAKYGATKLILSRYKILLEGLILALHGEVVYNLRKQQEYIRTKYCIPLLDDYVKGKVLTHDEVWCFPFKEVEQLHHKLATLIETIKWPSVHQSTIDLLLDKWLINHYVPHSFSQG